MNSSLYHSGKDRNKSVESYLYASDKRRIVDLLSKMGLLAASALRNALDAVITADVSLAGAVVKGDDAVNAVEEEIDLECLRAIAMRQPVRDELRFIFAALKTITDLERVGDESVNIAQWVIKLNSCLRRPLGPLLVDMGDIAEAMLRDALGAFKTSNGDISAEICRRDEQLDRMYSEAFNTFTGLMASDGTKDVNVVRALTGQMWIARHLERIGDHVTNIAERVYFMDKGERMARSTEEAAERHLVPSA
ncbi:MAG: phosphate signaling complex protein PhoU [Synergistaceae bacterium]|nr:phosphate signaling complex protein PhoU [Synergistaceae bacterium]